MEDECFGLPNGGMIAAIIFGIIIVLVGLSLLLGAYGISFVFWPFIIIIFGVLIVLAPSMVTQANTAKHCPVSLEAASTRQQVLLIMPVLRA
jgi:hypothetical protein